MSPVETMPLPRGLTARIYHDSDCAMPFDGDEAVRIVVLHRRYVDQPCPLRFGDPKCQSDQA